MAKDNAEQNYQERRRTVGERVDRASVRTMEWLAGRSERETMLMITAAAALAVLPSMYFQQRFLRTLCVIFGLLLVLFVGGWTLAGWMIQQRRAMMLARTRSLDEVRQLKWGAFETFVAALLEADGREIEPRGGPQPDGGIDMVARRDGRSVVVQCKHWQHDLVPPAPVRELYGIMARDGYDGAMFVTSGGFSQATDEEFAKSPRMTLMDGPTIVAKLKELDGKLPQPGDEDRDGPLARTRAMIERILPAAEEGTIRPPRCPKCRATMVLQFSREKREKFWTCREWRTTCHGQTRRLSGFESDVLDHRRS